MNYFKKLLSSQRFIQIHHNPLSKFAAVDD